MRKFILAAAALLIVAVPVRGDTPTLARYMADCREAPRICRADVGSYVLSSSLNHFACLPKDLSQDGAVDQMTDWLQKAADKPTLADTSADEAKWSAVKALWPCASTE